MISAVCARPLVDAGADVVIPAACCLGARLRRRGFKVDMRRW